MGLFVMVILIFGFIPGALSIYRERTDLRCSRADLMKGSISFFFKFVLINGMGSILSYIAKDIWAVWGILVLIILCFNFGIVYDYWTLLVRRIRDAGYGKGYACFGLIPVVFFLVVISLLIAPSKATAEEVK